MSNKIPQLPSTGGIKDPQVRAFCDGLVNAWQLRNGNIGHDDSERFITKAEWDEIAGSPTIKALAGLGKTGINAVNARERTSVPTIGPGNLPPAVQTLINLLNTPVHLFGWQEVNENINRMYVAMAEARARITALLIEVEAESDARIAAVANLTTGVYGGVPVIVNNPDHSIVSVVRRLWATLAGTTAASALFTESEIVDVTALAASATRLTALDTRLDDNAGAISTEETVRLTKDRAVARAINTVWVALGGDVTSLILDSDLASVAPGVAEATRLTVIDSRVDDNEAGILTESQTRATQTTALASYVKTMWAVLSDNAAISFDSELAQVSADGASMTGFHGIAALSGLKSRIFVQSGTPASSSAYTLKDGDLWINTGANNAMYAWDGAAWVSAGDARIASSAAFVGTETAARTTSNTAFASLINTMFATTGSNLASVDSAGVVTANLTAVAASQWQRVQSAIENPDYNPALPESASNRQYVQMAVIQNDINTYVNKEGGESAAWTIRAQSYGSDGQLKVAGFGLYLGDGQTSTTSAFVVEADSFAVVSANDSSLKTPFTVLTTPDASGNPVGAYIADAFIGIGWISTAKITASIGSDNFVSGVAGWRITSRNDPAGPLVGDAEFNNVRIRGTSTIGRLNLQGHIDVSVFVDNNSAASTYNPNPNYVHGSARVICASAVSGQGNAGIVDITDNSISVRLDFSSGGTVRIIGL